MIMKRIADQDKTAANHDSKLTPREGDLVMVRRHEMDMELMMMARGMIGWRWAWSGR